MRVKTARTVPAPAYLLERAKEILRNTDFIVDERGCWNWPRSVNGPNGYGRIMLRDRQRKNVGFLVHRLAWLVEYGTEPGDLFVCHRCDNRLCANPSHLFLGTEAENFADMRAKKRNPIGERHPQAKFDNERVKAIRGMLDAGFSIVEISMAFGVSRSSISAIKHGKTWRHVG